MAKGKYDPLYELGEDAILVMERAIRAGMPKTNVAKKLQGQGQLMHMTVKNLARLLDGYEKDVMDRALMRKFDEVGLLTATRQAAKLNLLDEMVVGVALQRRRVERAAEIAEKTPGILIEQHGKEIERYVGMVDKTLRTQMEMGVITKAPKRVTQTMIRDAHNPNKLTIEVTEEVMSAADDVMGMIEADVLALPAPDA